MARETALFYWRQGALSNKKTYKDTPETLLASILVMQDQLIEQRPAYIAADLTFEAEMSDGRTIVRANPLVQEYRALIKDFSLAIKAYKEITGDSGAETSKKLEGIREKFKVAT